MIWGAVDRRRLVNYREHSGFDNIEVATGGALLHYTHLCGYFHLQSNHKLRGPSKKESISWYLGVVESGIKNQVARKTELITFSVDLYLEHCVHQKL